MSYLETRITRTEFIKTRGAPQTQETAKTTLSVFDYFCKAEHQKDGDQVILEIQNATNLDQNYDRLYRFCNSFVQWLQEDHPDIIIQMHRYQTTVKKHHPSTIRLMISYLKQYLEEFGQIEFSERRFQRMVKIPRDIHEEPEPFTKEELRHFIDVSSPKRKALYMTLKDSGMRIGETIQLRKKDIDLTTNPVTITIQANYTKTKTGRTTFVTRETRPYLERLLGKIGDDDLVFGSGTNVQVCVNNEENLFARTRKRLGFTQRYESNGRFKKNLHSLRAFCATQLAEKHGEEFAHGFIGHKKYLGQYIRNKDTFAEKYLRAENQLMIYQTVEVVDQSLTLEEAKRELRAEIQDEFRKDREELIRLLKDKKEIQEVLI